MPARLPASLGRRRFGAVLLGALGAAVPAPAGAAQPYPEGLLVYDGEEFLELATYASLHPSGVLTMRFGTVDEIPAVDRVPMLICNLGLWSVTTVWFTSRRIFDHGGAERRAVPFAVNRMNLRTTRLRIRSLDDPTATQALMTAVKAGPDNPAYAVFAVTNRAVVRHYLVQMRAADAADVHPPAVAAVALSYGVSSCRWAADPFTADRE
jgi:hypothetical protein